MTRPRATAFLALAMTVAGCTPGWTGAGRTPVPEIRPSFRVVETASGRTVPFSDVVSRAAMADVVFFGEQHDDPETHFTEFALLEGIGRQRSNVVVSLEMFERDVQAGLNDYLAGRKSEADFLANARPWERYATDYRPLVLLAKVHAWRVVAANIPRPMASSISRAGLSMLDTVSASNRGWAATTLACPHDAYFDRFAHEMTGHTAGGGPPTASDAATMQAMTQRFYEAQCAKDETMAESIARQLTSGPATVTVVHFNGAFHSDYWQGTVQRLARRLPDSRRLVITAVPVAEPSSATLGELRDRADYVIFTRAPEKKPGA